MRSRRGLIHITSLIEYMSEGKVIRVRQAEMREMGKTRGEKIRCLCICYTVFSLNNHNDKDDLGRKDEGWWEHTHTHTHIRRSKMI